MDFIATSTNGDLRSAFNSLDLAVLSTSENAEGDSPYYARDHGKQPPAQLSPWTKMETATTTCSLLCKIYPWFDVDASLHYAARLIEAGDLPSPLLVA